MIVGVSFPTPFILDMPILGLDNTDTQDLAVSSTVGVCEYGGVGAAVRGLLLTSHLKLSEMKFQSPVYSQDKNQVSF